MRLSREVWQRRFAKSPAEHFLDRLRVSDEQPCEITGEGTLMLPRTGDRAHTHGEFSWGLLLSSFYKIESTASREMKTKTMIKYHI